jgi:hypothetical protein
MPSHTKTSDLVPQPATPSWRQRAWLAGKSEKSGAPITGVALSRPRCDYFKLLGKRVIEHDFDRQVAELQVRAAILNRFTRLGTPTTVVVIMP